MQEEGYGMNPQDNLQLVEFDKATSQKIHIEHRGYGEIDSVDVVVEWDEEPLKQPKIQFSVWK